MSNFTGTGALVRLALRRDRVLLPVFMGILFLMLGSGASATLALYSDEASRLAAVQVINSASSTLAMFGPIHDINSVGALATFKTGMMCLLAVAVLAMRLVVRHTRQEEETGRLEMIGAAVVGRYAPLTAAVIVSVGASIVAGLGCGLSLMAAGLPASGSMVLALGYALVGVAFAAVGAVVAQLTVSARAAGGMGTAVIGAFYLLRAAGDAVPDGNLSWLSWLSPIGWWQASRPLQGDRLWPLAFLVVFAAALFAVGFVLAARRDFAAGLLADKPGPAVASGALGSPFGLAWRLQRGSFITWAISLAVGGVVVGGLISSVGGFLKGPQMEQFIALLGSKQSLTDVFIALEMGFIGAFVSVYGLTSVLRLRSEETGSLAEPVLATSVGRVKWALSHLVIALVGSAALLTIFGASVGAVGSAALGDSTQFGRILGAALVQLPAVWVIIGIGTASFGLAPGQTVVSWVALVGFFLLGELGSLFKLDQWVMDLSPFAHIPRLPGGEITATPIVVLVLIAAALVVIGLVGLRRRNIGTA